MPFCSAITGSLPSHRIGPRKPTLLSASATTGSPRAHTSSYVTTATLGARTSSPPTHSIASPYRDAASSTLRTCPASHALRTAGCIERTVQTVASNSIAYS